LKGNCVLAKGTLEGMRTQGFADENVEDGNKKGFPADFGIYSHFGFSFAFCESTD
jgi:hypothetical protein